MEPASNRAKSHPPQTAIQAAFIRRASAAIERLVFEMPADALVDALTAPTDLGAIARLLGRAELAGSAISEIDPLVPALARGTEHREALRDTAGGMLSASEVGSFLSISRQAVDKRRRAGQLLAIREGGDWSYPACQFDQRTGVVLTGIADVVRGLEGQGPWVVLDFLLTADDVIDGRSPIEALRAGDTELVKRLVRAEAGDGFA